MQRERKPAPELLAEILRQKRAVLESGKQPQRVVLSMRNYRLIQAYHATLGEAPESMPDYVTRYTIFELPVYIDDADNCSVQ